MDSCLPSQNIHWLNPVKTVRKLQIPQNVDNFLTNRAAVSFSIRSLLHAAGCSVSSYQERH
jgi:hypothetical protein